MNSKIIGLMFVASLFFLEAVAGEAASSDLEAKVSELEAKVAQLEELVSNTGNSLETICGAIDGRRNHCCVNAAKNKLFCADTNLAAVFGINTSNGPKTCDISGNSMMCA